MLHSKTGVCDQFYRKAVVQSHRSPPVLPVQFSEVATAGWAGPRYQGLQDQSNNSTKASTEMFSTSSSNRHKIGPFSSIRDSAPGDLSIVEADSIAPIMAAVAAWDDVFDITIAPAVTAEEGLQLAQQLAQG